MLSSLHLFQHVRRSILYERIASISYISLKTSCLYSTATHTTTRTSFISIANTRSSTIDRQYKQQQRRRRFSATPPVGSVVAPADLDEAGVPPSAKDYSLSPMAVLGEQVPLDSIVKVYAAVSAPNYIQPWQNKSLKEVTGSGFVITDRRIITNAHVIADHKYVMVRKHGSPMKYNAKVEATGHECDLAILTVQDETFWEGLTAIEFGSVPELQQEVVVVGYPIGGDNLSVTRGVVSRVEPQQYAHGAARLLAVQIDSAINPGNSGGPAIVGNKAVGVAFQNLQGAENIGYVIPTPIIEHFLQDIQRSGRYVGFGDLGVNFQSLENSFFRSVLGLKAIQTGVLITAVSKLSPAFGVLEKNDVLLEVDDHVVGCDGTVHFRGRERISADFILSLKYIGDKLRVRIIRNGQEMEKEVIMGPYQPLVPILQYDMTPSYLIYGGLVFVPLTQPYLHEYGYDWYHTSPRKLCHLAMYGKPEFEGQQVVILSQVLPADVNVGYRYFVDHVVKKVNGIEIRNLQHMRDILDQRTSESAETGTDKPADILSPTLQEGTIVIETDDGKLIGLNRQEAEKSEQDILQLHRIPAARSLDLL